MKMVMVQSNLTLKGGAERVVLKIAQHYGAHIYTAEYDPANTFQGFSDLDVTVIGRGRISSIIPYGRVSQGITYGSAFYGFKVPGDYDVINAHMAPSHWARNRNERVLWYCHTPLREVYDMYGYRQSQREVYKRLLYAAGAAVVRTIDKKITSNIELIFANSANTKSRISKYLGRQDAEVLNGGVDYKEYFNDGDERYFLYPSRISPNKRQEYAVRAFKLFQKMKKGYKLVLVGPVSKDPFYQNYYDRVARLGRATGNIEIRGAVDDQELKRLYSRATAVLYPPIDEDYGLVPLEAMASGKPVIAINSGGPKETVSVPSTGFLVESEREMASRMLEIANDPSLAAAMGAAGTARVRRHYSWEHFFKVFDKGLAKVKKM